MEESYCVIFGAHGEIEPRVKFGKDALVLSDVGGFYKAAACGIVPDAVVGDFRDGAALDTEEFVVKIERDKADGALFAAVKVGLRRGLKTFVLYGAAGGLSGTAECFAALDYLDVHGARGYVIDGGAVATVFSDGKLAIPKTARGEVSVYAYGGAAEGVAAKGFDGTLGATLAPEQPPLPLRISDGGRGATVSVKRGALLVVFPR